MLRSAIAVVFAALLTCALAAPSFAEDEASGHGIPGMSEDGSILISQLDVDTRRRVRSLWSRIVCACPKENWSKTLTNCPDGCADQQKQMVLFAVRAGQTDEQVLDQQLTNFGPKVLAEPDGPIPYVMPFVILFAAGGVVFIAYRNWSRSAASRPRPAVNASDAELDAVARELEEIG